MFKKIEVRNFKSLRDFHLADLPKMVFLTGLNGSGKSTLLQFLGFAQAFLQGKVSEWREHAHWEAEEILSLDAKEKSLAFSLTATEGKRSQTWSAHYDPKAERCIKEELVEEENESSRIRFRFENKTVTLDGASYSLPAALAPKGSLFSFFAPTNPQDFFVLEEVRKLKVFQVLDPDAIAQSTQTSAAEPEFSVAPNGKGLVGFLAKMEERKRLKLFQQLQDFYPALTEHKIRKQPFGWKNLMLKEEGGRFFDATHLSYGTLRLLVILSQLHSSASLLAFDEIENGLNQEMLEKLLHALQGDNEKQILVTTHSAQFLNYLSDEEAREEVFFFYKDSDGGTQATKPFLEKSFQESLTFLGAGEALGNTDLVQYAQSLIH